MPVNSDRARPPQRTPAASGTLSRSDDQANASPETGDAPITMTLKTLTETDNYSITFSPSITVKQLKEHIQSQYGHRVDQQRLIYQGRVLNDQMPVKHYKVETGHALHLVVSPLRPSLSSPDANPTPASPRLPTIVLPSGSSRLILTPTTAGAATDRPGAPTPTSTPSSLGARLAGFSVVNLSTSSPGSSFSSPMGSNGTVQIGGRRIPIITARVNVSTGSSSARSSPEPSRPDTTPPSDSVSASGGVRESRVPDLVRNLFGTLSSDSPPGYMSTNNAPRPTAPDGVGLPPADAMTRPAIIDGLFDLDRTRIFFGNLGVSRSLRRAQRQLRYINDVIRMHQQEFARLNLDDPFFRHPSPLGTDADSNTHSMRHLVSELLGLLNVWEQFAPHLRRYAHTLLNDAARAVQHRPMYSITHTISQLLRQLAESQILLSELIHDFVMPLTLRPRGAGPRVEVEPGNPLDAASRSMGPLSRERARPHPLRQGSPAPSRSGPHRTFIWSSSTSPQTTRTTGGSPPGANRADRERTTSPSPLRESTNRVPELLEPTDDGSRSGDDMTSGEHLSQLIENMMRLTQGLISSSSADESSGDGATEPDEATANYMAESIVALATNLSAHHPVSTSLRQALCPAVQGPSNATTDGTGCLTTLINRLLDQVTVGQFMGLVHGNNPSVLDAICQLLCATFQEFLFTGDEPTLPSSQAKGKAPIQTNAESTNCAPGSSQPHDLPLPTDAQCHRAAVQLTSEVFTWLDLEQLWCQSVLDSSSLPAETSKDGLSTAWSFAARCLGTTECLLQVFFKHFIKYLIKLPCWAQRSAPMPTGQDQARLHHTLQNALPQLVYLWMISIVSYRRAASIHHGPTFNAIFDCDREHDITHGPHATLTQGVFESTMDRVLQHAFEAVGRADDALVDTLADDYLTCLTNTRFLQTHSLVFQGIQAAPEDAPWHSSHLWLGFLADLSQQKDAVSDLDSRWAESISSWFTGSEHAASPRQAPTSSNTATDSRKRKNEGSGHSQSAAAKLRKRS
ncbi:hypothetical protein H4R35_002484 [Dimargaris xerosporica]|nr:hypothetical protein H4R35_002484 [Dimargaris xerosporica]